MRAPPSFARTLANEGAPKSVMSDFRSLNHGGDDYFKKNAPPATIPGSVKKKFMPSHRVSNASVI